MAAWLASAGFGFALLVSASTSPLTSRPDGGQNRAPATESSTETVTTCLPGLPDFSTSGPGLLTVADQGVVLVAVQLRQPVECEGCTTAYRLFRFVPRSQEDTDWLPWEFAGDFFIDVELPIQDAGKATVHVDGVELFSFTTASLDVPSERNVLSYGTAAHIFNAIEISASSFSAEGAASLSLEGTDGEGTLSTTTILQSLADFGERGWYEDHCTNCNAGGPGSGGCSVGGCQGQPGSCSVISCGANRFACCKCLGPHGGAPCQCCETNPKPNDPPPG